MAQIQLLAFAGSLRTHSFNQGVLAHLVAGAEAAGASVTRPDPQVLDLPLYDGNLESATGLPAKARAWQQLMASHDGFLIAAPEYNGSITPLLKNAIDWASRPVNGASDSGRAVYEGRAAGLVSASQGALGGLRGLRHVREILTNLGVMVAPQQAAVTWPSGGDAGAGPNDRQIAQLRAVGAAAAELARRLRS